VVIGAARTLGGKAVTDLAERLECVHAAGAVSSGGRSKAGASSTHSIRFAKSCASENCHGGELFGYCSAGHGIPFLRQADDVVSWRQISVAEEGRQDAAGVGQELVIQAGGFKAPSRGQNGLGPRLATTASGFRRLSRFSAKHILTVQIGFNFGGCLALLQSVPPAQAYRSNDASNLRGPRDGGRAHGAVKNWTCPILSAQVEQETKAEVHVIAGFGQPGAEHQHPAVHGGATKPLARP